MPRNVNINGTIGVEATAFVADFRAAVALLGNEVPEPRRRTTKVNIDDDDL